MHYKNTNKLLPLIFFAFLSLALHANSIDSLKSLIKDKDDTANFRIYKALYYKYYDVNLDSALNYVELGIEQAQKQNNIYQLGLYYLRKGNVLLYMGDLKGDLFYSEKSVEQFKAINDSIMISISLNNWAVSLTQAGRYKKAGDALFQALDIAENNKDLTNLCTILSNTGNLYRDQGENKRALHFYYGALHIAQQIKNRLTIAGTYMLLGLTHKENNNSDSALYYYRLSLSSNSEQNDKIGQIYSLILIGGMFRDEEQFDSALIYLNKAIDLNKFYGSKRVDASINHEFGDFYYDKGQLYKALKFYSLSLSFYNKHENRKMIEEICMSMSDIYKEQQRYDSALFYHELYTQVKDSIFNNEKNNRLEELDAVYETSKKEKEILQLQKEQDRKRAQQFIYIGIIALLLIITVFAFIYYKSRQKRLVLKTIAEEQKRHFREVLNAQENERKRIAEELHDSLGPLLSVSKLYVSDLTDMLDSLPETKKELLLKTLNILDEATRETRTISHNLMPGVLVRSGLAPACRELVRKVKEAKAFEITFEHEGCEERLDEPIEISFFRVLQELLNNIIKHAVATKVTIKLSRQNGTLNMIVEDNGKGFKPVNNNQSDGIGLNNVKSRLSLINGEMTIESTVNVGTVIDISAPVKG